MREERSGIERRSGKKRTRGGGESRQCDGKIPKSDGERRDIKSGNKKVPAHGKK